jgi:hypothetical protein
MISTPLLHLLPPFGTVVMTRGQPTSGHERSEGKRGDDDGVNRNAGDAATEVANLEVRRIRVLPREGRFRPRAESPDSSGISFGAGSIMAIHGGRDTKSNSLANLSAICGRMRRQY